MQVKLKESTYMIRLVPCSMQVLNFSLVWQRNTLTDVSRFKIAVHILKRAKFVSIDWVNIQLWIKWIDQSQSQNKRQYRQSGIRMKTIKWTSYKNKAKRNLSIWDIFTIESGEQQFTMSPLILDPYRFFLGLRSFNQPSGNPSPAGSYFPSA